MIKNYLKLAFRNLKRNKGFFALNFIGLFVSVVVCILIALIIIHEKSFDKQTKAKVSIYRVVNNSSNSTGKSFSPITPYPLASALRAQMQDEKLISQIHFQEDVIVTADERKFKEANIVFADSVFPQLFHLAVKKGSIRNAFSQPGFAVLTQSTAKKYFGEEESIGKRIKIENILEVEIAAVIEDAPGNSHLPYKILVSYLSMKPEFIGGFPLDQWGINANGFTYIGLNDIHKTKQVEAALASIAGKNINAEKGITQTIFKLQPLSDIHFNQAYADNNPSYTINYQYLYIIGCIGLFLILAACINYTNLSTAMAIKKSKEVGVRKTMGASRSQLMGQFLAETFLLTAIVIIAATATARYLLPSVNSFLEKNIPLNFLSTEILFFLFILWITISVLSGIYPALILSGFKPINALKNKLSTPKTSTVFLRRGLVVFQFLTAQILIIGALVVTKQMQYINSKPLGFQKEKVVDIGLPENKVGQLSEFRNKLAAIPGISNISFSLGAPVSDNNFGTTFNVKEKYTSERLDVQVKVADRDYLKTYGLQLVAGRWFDEADETKTAKSIPDSLRQYALVINEKAVKSLGFANAEDALGKYVTFGLNDITAPVIGVIKDYHTESLHAPVSPVVMMPFPFFYYNAGIRLADGYSASTIGAIEKAWTSVYPQHLFETNFLDEHIASLYKKEKRTLQLFNLFTLLSVLINALGLIGLLSFIIEQKTKEIGIRKVLGATIADISIILSKDFLRLIVIAFLIAAPVAWLLMNKWLQDFVYRTSITWWVFAAAGFAALLVTLIAVGFQTIKAAIANPVKSLRTE